MSNLRAVQKQQTRQAILDAYLDLAHNDSATSVSIPAVASRAGVSVRTVYRYFATKDELKIGAAYRLTEQTQSQVSPVQSVTRHNLESFLVHLWSDFAKQIPAVAAEHHTAAGRELRLTRLDDTRTTVKQNLPAGFRDDETADLVVAMMSSSMFLELVDRMGHSPARAASMAARASLLLLEDVERQAAEFEETRGTSTETQQRLSTKTDGRSRE